MDFLRIVVFLLRGSVLTLFFAMTPVLLFGAYVVLFSGIHCSSEWSPDGRFEVEDRGFPRFIAMPGDGGSCGGYGYSRLRDGRGNTLRKMSISSLSATEVEWTLPYSVSVGPRGENEQWLLPKEAPVSPQFLSNYRQQSLIRAIRNGDVRAATSRLREGASPNVSNFEGRLPLVEAANANQPELVTLLLGLGADPKIADADGLTALHVVRSLDPSSTWSKAEGLAYRRKNEIANGKIVKLLVEAGADINALDSHGRTPLFSINNAEVAQYLLSQGATVNVCDNFGRCPLNYVHDQMLGNLLTKYQASDKSCLVACSDSGRLFAPFPPK